MTMKLKNKLETENWTVGLTVRPHLPTQMFKFLSHRTFFGRAVWLSLLQKQKRCIVSYFLFWYAPHLLLPRHAYVPQQTCPELDKGLTLQLLFC